MLHVLTTAAPGVTRPARFTYPFHYTPHPLCVAAAGEVRRYLESQPHLLAAAQEGKMFGVLVVATPPDHPAADAPYSFLAAYSGELAGDNKWPWFVPPIYDLLQPASHFQDEEARIVALTQRIAQATADAATPAADLDALKAERRRRSQELQQWLFKQYRVSDALGTTAHFIDIFAAYRATYQRGSATPPSGSGECCAPKLLQAAYDRGLKPLAMAEFWVGRSPADELRTDGNFYPACSGRCRPILTHMLRGLDVDDNPLLRRSRAVADELQIVHLDHPADSSEPPAFVVVSKPSGMLSVPGNDPDIPSVLCEMQQRFPRATGPLIVHRLDMDTSGLMVVALTESAYHELQRQFVTHKVEKRYTARLEERAGSRPRATSGSISLPLCLNPYDRPRQIVSYDYGRRAVTRYEFVGSRDVWLWPETGRTHQLRVHCAHRDGLDRPIAGDALYGNGAQQNGDERLMLHADTLSFNHPTTGQRLTFHADAPFADKTHST